MCDANGDGALTQKEIINCINANVQDKATRKEMKADVRAGFKDADVNGDGALSEDELSAAMNDGEDSE